MRAEPAVTTVIPVLPNTIPCSIPSIETFLPSVMQSAQPAQFAGLHAPIVSSTSAGLVDVALNARMPWCLGVLANRAADLIIDRRIMARRDKEQKKNRNYEVYTKK